MPGPAGPTISCTLSRLEKSMAMMWRTASETKMSASPIREPLKAAPKRDGPKARGEYAIRLPPRYVAQLHEC